MPPTSPRNAAKHIEQYAAVVGEDVVSIAVELRHVTPTQAKRFLRRTDRSYILVGRAIGLALYKKSRDDSTLCFVEFFISPHLRHLDLAVPSDRMYLLPEIGRRSHPWRMRFIQNIGSVTRTCLESGGAVYSPRTEQYMRERAFVGKYD